MKRSSTKPEAKQSPIEFAINLNKSEYYQNDQIIGFVKLLLREERTITDIKLKFKQREYWNHPHEHFVKEKTINKQIIEVKKYIVEHSNENNPYSLGVKLTGGVYIFPFSLTIPNTCINTFEYSDDEIKTYVRSYIKFSFSDSSPYYCDYPIIIKTEMPKNDVPSSALSKTNIYKWGMFNSGIVKMRILSNKMIYKIGNIAHVKISIDNTESDIMIISVKLSLYRKFSFFSAQGLTLEKKIKINSKIIEVSCKAREKAEIEGKIEVDDCGFLEETMNVINDRKDSVINVSFLLPSTTTKVVQCEYYIKATAYAEEVVFKKSRPRCLLPIQVLF